jgi:hypothetical protein
LKGSRGEVIIYIEYLASGSREARLNNEGGLRVIPESAELMYLIVREVPAGQPLGGSEGSGAYLRLFIIVGESKLQLIPELAHTKM